MRTLSLVGSILLFAAGPGLGQRPAQPFPTASTPVFTVRWAVTDTQPRVTPPPTYWLEGGVIGGFLVGALGATFAGGFCGYSDAQHGSCTDNVVKGAFFGAALGFTIGSLIGGQIPKHREPAEDP